MGKQSVFILLFGRGLKVIYTLDIFEKSRSPLWEFHQISMSFNYDASHNWNQVLLKMNQIPFFNKGIM